MAKFLADTDFSADLEWQQTEALKKSINDHKLEYPSLGLTRDLFDRVLDWKLRSQRRRVEQYLGVLTDDLVGEVTGTAFRVKHLDESVLDRVRTEILLALPGVGLGVASAILTLYYPQKYGIIDYRAWDELNERDPDLPPITRTFTIGQYMEYLAAIRAFAEKRNVAAQAVDYALWKIWELRRAVAA